MQQLLGRDGREVFEPLPIFLTLAIPPIEFMRAGPGPMVAGLPEDFELEPCSSLRRESVRELTLFLFFDIMREALITVS